MNKKRAKALTLFILRLLYSVLPETVANELRHQRPVAPKRLVIHFRFIQTRQKPKAESWFCFN